MSKSYTIVDDNGDATNRMFFADRLEIFNQRFPLKEGWALMVTYEPTDFTALATNGESPRLDKAMLIKAMLENPQGRVVRMASSLSSVSSWKAHECTETNAVARLLEFCGIRGELLTEDDQRELQRAGFARTERDTSDPAKSPPAKDPPAPDPAPANNGAPTTGEAKPADRTPPPRVAAPTAADRARERGPNDKPSQTTVRALQSLGRQLNQEVTIPETEAEAKALMSELSAKRTAKTNGSGATH